MQGKQEIQFRAASQFAEDDIMMATKGSSILFAANDNAESWEMA